MSTQPENLVKSNARGVNGTFSTWRRERVNWTDICSVSRAQMLQPGVYIGCDAAESEPRTFERCVCMHAWVCTCVRVISVQTRSVDEALGVPIAPGWNSSSTENCEDYKNEDDDNNAGSRRASSGLRPLEISPGNDEVVVQRRGHPVASKRWKKDGGSWRTKEPKGEKERQRTRVRPS